MLSTSDILRLAYDLKEDYRSFNFSIGEDNVVLYDKLNDLIERFKASNIPEYREFWKLLEHWKVEIVNSFNTYKGKRISNASIERKNKDIKDLIRIQFGLKNFIRFKSRIVYCFNDNSHILVNKKKIIKGINRSRHNKKVVLHSCVLPPFLYNIPVFLLLHTINILLLLYTQHYRYFVILIILF